MAKYKMGTSIWIRARTREKLESIADARRWTQAETIDALADDWLAEHPEVIVPPPLGSEPDGSGACQDAPGATQSLPPCSE